MQSELLIQTLIEQTRHIINQAEKLKESDWNALTWRPNNALWNVLECLEHLNRYSYYYLPTIEKRMKASNTKPEATFSSGMLGAYFANSILPKEKLNKMKTLKDKDPINTQLDKSVLDKFLEQQIKLLDLLDQSRNVSLNKIKVPISITRFIRLKLGDTFQFYINHMIRHMKQIKHIQAHVEKAQTPA